METGLKIQIAPGHVFQQKLKTGLEWQPNVVNLWDRGVILQTAEHQTKTPYEYWYELKFLESFPSVECWWFRSKWSGQISINKPTFVDNGAVWGVLDIKGDGENFYSIIKEFPRLINVPLPQSANFAVNIGLRFTIARLVYASIFEEVRYGVPYNVSSVVNSTELPQLLSKSLDHRENGFALEGVNMPLRDYFCQVQGLKKEPTQ